MSSQQHPKRGILKDFSKTELLRMREDGLSNREIADRIGCAYSTIYGILGKQPNGLRYSCQFAAPSSNEILPDDQIEKFPSRVKVLKFTAVGAAGSYIIDIEDNIVTLESQELLSEQLPDFIADLVSVGKMIEKMGRDE